MGKSSAPPAVIATPVLVPAGLSTAHAVAEPSLYIVALPIGCSDLGFDVVGSPPCISNVSKLNAVANANANANLPNLKEGHYIHGLIMPDIVIDNLVDSKHLTELLRVNMNGPRHIMVSPSPFFADPVAGNQNTGALYKHALPVNLDLGLHMKGFPPGITYVQPNSPLAGRVYSGQGVHAVVIPGQPVFNLQAGAFTSDKVQERLASTSHIEGRQLVVKDGAQPRREKGSHAAFDDCAIQ
jgi:hypothetical protein